MFTINKDQVWMKIDSGGGGETVSKGIGDEIDNSHFIKLIS